MEEVLFYQLFRDEKNLIRIGFSYQYLSVDYELM